MFLRPTTLGRTHSIHGFPPMSCADTLVQLTPDPNPPLLGWGPVSCSSLQKPIALLFNPCKQLPPPHRSASTHGQTHSI